MKGFYWQFARLAIRLLIRIYWNQIKVPGPMRQVPGPMRPQDDDVIAEAQDWLEKYK